MHHLLVHGVVVLTLEQADHNSWVSDDPTLVNVSAQLFSQISPITLTLKFDSEWILNLELELATGFLQIFHYFSSKWHNSLTLLVDDDPLILLQVNGVKDRLAPQDLLITVDYLILVDHLRSWEDLSLSAQGISLDLDIPVLNSLLALKLLNHLANAVQLIFRVDSGLCQSIAHTRTLLKTVRNAINQAKFRGQVAYPSSYVY